MLVPICVNPVCVIFLLWQKYSAPLQHRLNWYQPPLLAARRPSRANGGAPVLAALHQLSPARTALSLLGPPNQSILPSLPLQAIFKPTPQVLCALTAPPNHFWTDTTCQAKPIQSLWGSPVIPQQITCPSNLNTNPIQSNPCEKVLSFLIRLPTPPSHFQTDMPIQANPCETSPSFLIRLPDPQSHFRTDMPSQANPSPVRQSCH